MGAAGRQGRAFHSGIGFWGVMSMRDSAMRPLWLASIRALRGMTVVGSFISTYTSTLHTQSLTRHPPSPGQAGIW